MLRGRHPVFLRIVIQERPGLGTFQYQGTRTGAGRRGPGSPPFPVVIGPIERVAADPVAAVHAVHSHLRALPQMESMPIRNTRCVSPLALMYFSPSKRYSVEYLVRSPSKGPVAFLSINLVAMPELMALS